MEGLGNNMASYREKDENLNIFNNNKTNIVANINKTTKDNAKK